MSFVRLLTAIFLAGLIAISPRLASAATPQAPTPIIFDTDMYSDIDDMLALAMLHTLQDRGEVKLLAVTVGTEAKWAGSYVDLVNNFYGHADIPIGMVRGGISANHKRFTEKPQPYSPKGINYTQHLAQLRNREGTLVYPHKLTDSNKAEEAVRVLRRVLAAQPDHSVVMVQVGYSTNFARLLESKPDRVSNLDGRTLVKRKVRLLSVMAGNFSPMEFNGKKYPAGGREFNLIMDVPAAQKLFSEWPTPIVASGYEIGAQMLYPQTSADRDFNYIGRHPIAETYQYTAPHYRKASGKADAPHDHPTFDLTSVLYAARPDGEYFSLSKPGKITILADGGSKFEAVQGGAHHYLILTDGQKARTLEAMVMLVSQPPVHGPKTGR